ncbi:hypothetical protein FSP39_019840 [Pinctada imbricata]|uniref:Large ribosomal subunit protein mL44 dsRNA binding domain-containing protein n=1 Tax=Pinctada imbricata TaxID=66713 RepID=A0AA89BJN1_PINIB|nr:hypothetical protein FSP39_019840 [Pinctada imbricata]
MLAVYYVGIYSDKQLLGKSAGETVTIAEEMAARNALKNLMGTDDGRKPMKFDSDLSEIPLDFSRVNPSLKSLKLPR